MGLSRKPDLMDRDLDFENLSSLIYSYDQAYRNVALFDRLNID